MRKESISCPKKTHNDKIHKSYFPVLKRIYIRVKKQFVAIGYTCLECRYTEFDLNATKKK